MMFHLIVFFILLVSVCAYVIINALLVALFLNYKSGAKRFKSFFKEMLAKGSFAAFLFLGCEAVVIRISCWVGRIAYMVGVRCPASILVSLLNDTLVLSILFFAFVVTLHYRWLQGLYHSISSKTLLYSVLIGNGCGSLVRLAVIYVLYALFGFGI